MGLRPRAREELRYYMSARGYEFLSSSVPTRYLTSERISRKFDVRKEFTKQFEKLMLLKYCKSSEKVCPAGPPGLPGPTGQKGNVAGGEQRERKGLKDHLESPEKQE